jgi:chromosome segregation ATPase
LYQKEQLSCERLKRTIDVLEGEVTEQEQQLGVINLQYLKEHEENERLKLRIELLESESLELEQQRDSAYQLYTSEKERCAMLEAELILKNSEIAVIAPQLVTLTGQIRFFKEALSASPKPHLDSRGPSVRATIN